MVLLVLLLMRISFVAVATPQSTQVKRRAFGGLARLICTPQDVRGLPEPPNASRAPVRRSSRDEQSTGPKLNHSIRSSQPHGIKCYGTVWMESLPGLQSYSHLLIQSHFSFTHAKSFLIFCMNEQAECECGMESNETFSRQQIHGILAPTLFIAVGGPWHTGYKSFLLSAELFIGTVLACAVKYMLVLWV